MVPHFTPALHRLFTPDEARDLLGMVRPQLDELVSCVRRARTVMSGPASEQSQVELTLLQQRAQWLVDALRGLGLRVLDLEPVSVAFPGQYRGQPALLCWQQGEADLTWCRGSEGTDAEREPLAETDAADWLYYS